MSDPVGTKARDYDTDHKLINDMANHMFEKMRKNKHKAHWSTVRVSWLLDRLKEEVAELDRAMYDLNITDRRSEIISECADVANFAAMIADWVSHPEYKLSSHQPKRN